MKCKTHIFLSFATIAFVLGFTSAANAVVDTNLRCKVQGESLTITTSQGEVLLRTGDRVSIWKGHFGTGCFFPASITLPNDMRIEAPALSSPCPSNDILKNTLQLTTNGAIWRHLNGEHPVSLVVVELNCVPGKGLY